MYMYDEALLVTTIHLYFNPFHYVINTLCYNLQKLDN